MSTKNHQINFRASECEYLALKVMADREDLSQSEMLRRIVREAAERYGLNALGLIGILQEWEGTQNETSQ